MIKLALLSFLILSVFLLKSSYSAVSVDMTAKEVDKIKGTVRVRDLVVNDSGRIGGGNLCIKNGIFYLPDDTFVLNSPIGKWGIDLKITVLPGRKVKATTVMPKTNDKEKIKGSIESFLMRNLKPSPFKYESPFCGERRKKDDIGVNIQYLKVESIDDLLSLREVYEKLIKENVQN